MSTPEAAVAALVLRARAAQRAFETWTQERVDEAVTAAAWAIVEPGRNRALAELAVRDTGLGDVADKIAKNRRKTIGLLRDLAGAKSVGVISEDRERGLVEIARPAGVVAAITPSTNPAATPANNILNALKGRNAIIVAPSPKGQSTLTLLLEFVHAELDRIGAPRDLVLQLPAPVTREHTLRADAAGGPRRRDRLADQRARRVLERHAGARRRRRQRDGHRRRNGRRARRRREDRALEDVRPRDLVLVGEQRDRVGGGRTTRFKPRSRPRAGCC